MKALVMIGVIALAGCPGSGSSTKRKSAPITISFDVVQVSGELQRVIKEGDTLRTGDEVAFVITVDRPVYLYLVQFFPDDRAAVVYPDEGEDNRVVSQKRIDFVLDPPEGQEVIYVVASDRPIDEADAAVKGQIAQIKTSGQAPEAVDIDAGATADTDANPGTGPVAVDAGPGAGADAGPVVADAGTAVVADASPADAATDPKPDRSNRIARYRPPPGAISGCDRRIGKCRGLRRKKKAGGVEATTDSGGVAVFSFWFRHEPSQ